MTLQTWNSLGALTSKLIMGSNMIGDALLNAENYTFKT